MLYNETYGRYFDDHGLKNIFMPFMEIDNPQVQRWIVKSRYEINRFSNYVILIDKYEKEPTDKFTLSSIHESLASCSVSIAFSIFNIFALITGTEASFFDDHIKDYFKIKVNLNSEELYLLSFKWHTSIQAINSLGYSNDEKLYVYKCDNTLGFKILNMNDKLSDSTKRSKINSMIYSKEFFIIHLLYILSTIALITKLISMEMNISKVPISNRKSSYLEIENISELMSIYEDCLSIKIKGDNK
jgi:hypothetical protein